jgi:drug/metabolite transporter (DMT)-like permease
VILCVGLLAVSIGSILVRFSQEAPSLVIAFYRMLWATLLLSPFFWKKRIPFEQFLGRDYLIAGLALALHFAFWIHSLRFTSVAVSVLLVNTSPVLVALLSFFVFREKLSLRGIIGLLSAVLGSSVLFWNDIENIGDWKGAVFAILGAAALGIYLISGRKIRQGTDLIHYVYPTYAYATIILGLLALFSGHTFFGFSPQTYCFLFLLGMIPQAVGHTSCNWALEYLPATIVSTLILVEPVLATMFAWTILGESIDSFTALGGLLVGLGIFLISRWGIKQREEEF